MRRLRSSCSETRRAHENWLGKPIPFRAVSLALAMEIVVAGPEHASQAAAIYGPIVRDTAISFELEPPSPAAMARRIEETTRQFPWLVALGEGGEVIGYAYGHAWRERAAYAWVVETSVYVAAGHRGRGAGSRLYRVLVEILRRQGYRQAVAGITLPNPASEGLHESVGFRPVGRYARVGWKLGAWHDVGWWQLDIGGAEAPPPPLVSFSALVGSLGSALLAL